MKTHFFSAFRRQDMNNTEISGQPRLVRKPAKKFSKVKRQRSVSPSGSGTGDLRRRRNAFHGAFSSRATRLGKQLTQAVAERDSVKVREILESEPDMEEYDGVTDVLHRACENKDLATVAILLRFGAAVNTMGGRDCAPIHIAVRNSSLGIVSLLLSHGSYPNIGTKFEKRTPLHVASTLGNDEMVKFLLENAAKIDQGDIYGSTPLHMAARMGHLAVARTLLDNGAGADTYNNDGWTALHLAAECGNIAVVRLLSDGRANIDSQNRYGRTPLHWACACGHVQVVEVLLKHGASVTVTDRHGKTAIDHAVNEKVRAVLSASLTEQAAADKGSPWTRGNSSTIGQLVMIDCRSRRELFSSGHISKQTLLEEEENERLGKERRRRIGEKASQLYCSLGSETDQESGLTQPDIRHYRSWTDCRSASTDSGRGSSETSSSIWGTLQSKDGSLARYMGLRSVAMAQKEAATEANGDQWSKEKVINWSRENLEESYQEERADDTLEANSKEVESFTTEGRLAFCYNQLGKLKNAFKSRALTLDRGMAKAVKDTSMALEDGSLKYMIDTLHSTRSAIQSLQAVMDEFTIQLDGEMTLVEQSLRSLISDHGDSDVFSVNSGPLDIFFHFMVSHLAHYLDGWRRLIQVLSLPMDRECEVLRMVTKAATAEDETIRLRRLSRSVPDVAGHLADHLLITDLSACALCFVQRHLVETGGAKSTIRRVFELMDCALEDNPMRTVVRNLVRLMSSLTSKGHLSESALDKYCSLISKQLVSNTETADLASQLQKSERKTSNPGTFLLDNREGRQPSAGDVISGWRRRKTTDGSSTLVENITDLLIALINIGREDLACSYCRL